MAADTGITTSYTTGADTTGSGYDAGMGGSAGTAAAATAAAATAAAATGAAASRGVATLRKVGIHHSSDLGF